LLSTQYVFCPPARCGTGKKNAEQKNL